MQTVRDTKTLEHNNKLLHKFIRQEQELAHLLDRKEGLVYLFALNYGKMCSACAQLLDGKVFLLYDGRTGTRHTVPTLPNPSCLQPIEYEDEKECGFSWMHFNPRSQYLKKEKQYYRSCCEYLDTWHLQMRATSKQEWTEWIAAHPEIELYEPPSLIDSVRLSTFEKYCIKYGRVNVSIDSVPVSLRDLGLLSLLTIMQTANVALTGFGSKLPNLGIDFSEGYDNLENAGKKSLAGLVRKIKYQDSGGRLSKPVNAYIRHHLLSLEVHATFGLTKEWLNSTLRLTQADIQVMSKYGLPS